MRIVRLTAENVKRLKAVEIEPDGTMQIITGRNAQGKSSVLDAIWLALGGGAASRETVRPIRDGEEKASVTLDLGDLLVTRTWTGSKTALSVTSPDGAKYGSPQTVLDALIGRLSFDPLEFTRLSGREQVAALLDLVDLNVDLPALAAQRQKLYDERTNIGRQGKALEGQLAGLGAKEEAPTEEVAASALITTIRDEQREDERQRAERQRLESIQADAARLEAELRRTREVLAAIQESVSEHRAIRDVAAMEDELESVEETNRKVRRNAERTSVAASLTAAREAYKAAGAAIEDIDQTKADALAKAKFPVDGLGFDDHGATYNGVPFSQASAAEQIRVSLAMAMSLNPKLRVIRILDGSLLDADNLRIISEMAAEQDYQIWIERVADGSGVGVVIEDGSVLA